MSERATLRVIYSITALVILTVVGLHCVPRPAHVPNYARYLPPFNACLNATCAALLVTSFLCIRNGKVAAHRRINIAAFILSTIFLMSYIGYHATAPETKFPAGNPWRPVYLALLASHILLAMAVLPLVLISFHRGLTNQIDRHRRIVRWSYPVWLYVAISGVIVYLMIAPYYP